MIHKNIKENGFEVKACRLGDFIIEHNTLDKDEMTADGRMNAKAAAFLEEHDYVPFISVHDVEDNFYAAMMFGTQMYYLLGMYCDMVGDGKNTENIDRVILEKLTAMYFVCSIPGDAEYHKELIAMCNRHTDRMIDKYEDKDEDGNESGDEGSDGNENGADGKDNGADGKENGTDGNGDGKGEG